MTDTGSMSYKHEKNNRRAIVSAMGPGILAALAGMDAGGIATFSIMGASYGFGMLWSIPITCILLMVVQETAARMACVTGKGFSSLIREQFGVRAHCRRHGCRNSFKLCCHCFRICRNSLWNVAF